VPSESVFAFRAERRAPGSGWEVAPDFLVHVDGLEPAHLTWTAEDGVETALAFSAAGFVGHQLGIDGRLVEVRGVADGVRESAGRAARFSIADGPFTLLLDDGRGVAVRSATWRDASGVTSIAMVPAEQAGHADVTRLVTGVKATREHAAAGEVAANLVLSWGKWLSFGVYAEVEFEFAEPTVVDAYVFTSADDEPDRDPADWTVRGSVDGRLWRNLDTRSGQPSISGRHASRTYGIAAPGAFRYYRIDFRGTSGSPELQLGGVRFLAGGRRGFVGHRVEAEPVEFSGTVEASAVSATLDVVALPAALPWSDQAQLLRTAFGDDEAWEALKVAVREGSGEYSDEPFDFLEAVDDRLYQGLTKDRIMAVASAADYPHSYLVVADDVTFASSEHPLLVIDLYEEPGREFRCTPEDLYSVSANLDISNMDYAEFAEAVEEDGVFRGF